MHPIIGGLLEYLPPAGEPFPKMDQWLALFKSALDLIYDVAPDPLVCPLCGGAKSRYATACVKHNAGSPGNVGGPGGDRSSPAALIAGVGQPKVGILEVDVRQLAPEQRQQLSAAVASRNGPAIARAVTPEEKHEDKYGNVKHPCPGVPGRECSAWISKLATHCVPCNAELRRKRPVSPGHFGLIETKSLPGFDSCPGGCGGQKLKNQEKCGRCTDLADFKPSGERIHIA